MKLRPYLVDQPPRWYLFCGRVEGVAPDSRRNERLLISISILSLSFSEREEFATPPRPQMGECQPPEAAPESAERRIPSMTEIYDVFQAWNSQGGSFREGVTLTAQALDVSEEEVEEAVRWHSPPLPAPSYPPPGLPPGLTRAEPEAAKPALVTTCSSPFDALVKNKTPSLVAVLGNQAAHPLLGGVVPTFPPSGGTLGAPTGFKVATLFPSSSGKAGGSTDPSPHKIGASFGESLGTSGKYLPCHRPDHPRHRWASEGPR